MQNNKISQELTSITRPSWVQISITERCNLRCVHCDIWKKHNHKELSVDQWFEIILKLKEWLGPYRIDISGGEPFIRKDLIEIIEFCNRNEVKPIVTTNATLLDEDTIKVLSRIDNLTLNISLDGISSQTYDYLRGVNGTYNRVMDVLRNFRACERKCLITLATILMGYNIDEIMHIIKSIFVDELADGISFQALSHNFSCEYKVDWCKKSKLWPQGNDKKYLSFLIDEIIKLKNNGLCIYNSIKQLEYFKIYFERLEQDFLTEPCKAGNINFIINPSGEMLLCWNMDPIGDVTKEKPAEIWHSDLNNERRKQIESCNGACRILNCNF